MTQHESALHELAERLTDTDQGLAGSLAEILAAALQELIESEATDRVGAEHGQRLPTRVTQRRSPTQAAGDPRGRGRGRDPQAAAGVVLSRAARAPPADRQGVVGSDHDRLHHRDVDQEGR